MANKAKKKDKFTFQSKSKLERAKLSFGKKKYSLGELLVAYDKLGGLVIKNGQKVETGSFIKKAKKNEKETKQPEKKTD